MKFSVHICALAVALVLPTSAKATDDRVAPPPGSSIVIHLTRDKPHAHHRHHARRHHARVRYAKPASGRGAVEIGKAATGAPWVAEAKRYLGGNPTGWRSLWCARFLNQVLEHVGIRGTGSNFARSFARWGMPAGPQPGAIAVMARGGGGHVGIVLADHGGSVLVLSGNHGHRVAIGRYSKARIIAYRWPPVRHYAGA